MQRTVFAAFAALIFGAITVMDSAPIVGAEIIAEATVNVRKAPLPEWIIKQSYDPGALAEQATGGPAYLLHSYQRKLTDTNEIYYSRRVKRLDDVESIEDASQLSISFDPSYERLEIHNILVIRDGVADDRLNIANFKLLHTESDASRLIFNGTVSASLILRDIRAGDVLDVAYSIHGKNPAFVGHISDVIELQYSVPVGHQYRSIRVPDDRTYQNRRYANAPEPKVEYVNNEILYSWDQRDVPSLSGQNNVPNWYTDFGYFELTDMPDWESLGAFYSPAYKRTQPLSAELVAQIETIKSLHSDDKSRTRAALDFVQRHIRYLGIEVGKGGYVPRDPSLVLAQRFGDCKDKTVLLVAMLGEMNIKASPMLVDTDNYDHFTDRLPSGYAFDHVITKVTIGETDYWLDGTRNPQTGTLDTLEQSDYGAGLVVEGPQSAVHTKPGYSVGEKFEAVVIDTFDLVGDKTTIGYTAKTILRGGRADGFLRDFYRDGRASMEEDYLSYYQDNYPSIEKTKDMEVIEDRDEGSVTVLESYRIPNGWTIKNNGRSKKFSAWPYEVRGKMTDVDKVKRAAPYATTGLAYVRHELKFLVDDSWSFSSEKPTYENAHFNYSKTTSFENNIYSQIYEFRGKTRAIPAVEHIAIANKFEEAFDESGVGLTWREKDAAAAQTRKFRKAGEWVGRAIMALIVGFGIFGFVKAIGFDKERRAEAVFYPVSIAKFLVMSVATFGLYLFYWTYKNWQWLRDVQNEPNIPFWRSLFGVLMNFSLFPRIASEGEDGGNQLKTFASFLALIYLLLAVSGRVTTYLLDGLSLQFRLTAIFLTLFLYILLTLPFVVRILRLNDSNGDAVRLNSQYHWHGVYALVMGLLFWVVMGIVMISAV